MNLFYISKLIYFQKDVTECDLSIHTPETPSIIQFPLEYLQRKASISIISPKSGDLHKYLNFTLTTNNKNNFKLTNEKQLDFEITERDLKLDFLGINLVNEEDYSDQSNAYEIHSARLQLKIADSNGIVIKCLTSKILRNKNLDVSEDISVLTVAKSLSSNYPDRVVITLERPIPYFPCEITAKFPNQNKSYKIENRNMFPPDKFYIKSDENFDFTKIVLECPYFQKSWHYLAPENLSIEARKKKPITQKICVLINQINFGNRLEARTLGTDKDKKRIKEVFSNLNYDVKILEDMTTIDLKNAMRKIIRNDFKSYHDNIVVFVSSHGDKGGFHTSNEYMPFDDLLQLFLPNKCPHFVNRPKLFYYSICLGTNENTTLNGKLIIPEYSNIFQGFSTVSGYLSLRSKNGTPYIQTLLNNIEDKPRSEVTEIHNETQRQLGQQLFPEKFYVIPSVSQCLTEKTYFKQ